MFEINIWISGFLLSSTFVAVLMSVYAMNKKGVPAARPFSFLCICTAMYSFGYAMELLNSDINTILSWNFFQHMGIVFIPAFWVLLAVEYSGNEKKLTRLYKTVIFSVPLLILIVRYTNPVHHLFYKSMEVKTNVFFSVIHLEKGPLYIVDGIYITISFLLANLLYFKIFYRSKGVIRYQSMLMFIASLLPYAAFCLLITNSSPLDIDFTPITIIFSNILFLVGLFKYQFLDLIPLARDKVFESIKDAVLVLDINYNILDFNVSASNIFIKLDKEAIGKNLSILSDEYADFVQSVLEGKETQFEIKSDNCSCFYFIKMSMLYSKFNSIIGYIVILNDITEQVENIRKLEMLASTDGLTGIYNRRYFLECCEYELKRTKNEEKPLSLILFDIDNFKSINDNLGHLAGDAVLKQIIEVCRENIRSEDILGRFGGEEFIILLPHTAIEEAMVIGERVRKSMEMSNVTFEGRKIKVTSSFGVSGITGMSIQSGMDLDVLIKLADKALYMAKAGGKNCIKVLSKYDGDVA